MKTLKEKCVFMLQIILKEPGLSLWILSSCSMYYIRKNAYLCYNCKFQNMSLFMCLLHGMYLFSTWIKVIINLEMKGASLKC